MKIKIDADLCTGCEDCTIECPCLFQLGSDWIAEPVHETVPAGKEEEAKKTAGLCQFEAILLED